MQLQTERFTLRPLAEQDAELFKSLYGDKSLMRHIGDVMDEKNMITVFNASLKAMQKQAPKFYLWVIEENQQALGVAGISAIKAKIQAEMGIILFRLAHRKQVGPEVLSCLIDYCKEKLQLSQLLTNIDANNLAAIKLAKRVGFEDFHPTAGKSKSPNKVELQGKLLLTEERE